MRIRTTTRRHHREQTDEQTVVDDGGRVVGQRHRKNARRCKEQSPHRELLRPRRLATGDGHGRTVSQGSTSCRTEFRLAAHGSIRPAPPRDDGAGDESDHHASARNQTLRVREFGDVRSRKWRDSISASGKHSGSARVRSRLASISSMQQTSRRSPRVSRSSAPPTVGSAASSVRG